MKNSSVTQQMVNSFPAWSSARRDEQSLAYQTINTVALNLEDMQKQLITGSKNHYLGTVNLDEIDLVHRYELAADTEFTKVDNDPGSFEIVTPTVSGRLGAQWFELELASNNDIETFWYKSIPTRYSSTVTISGDSCEVLAAVTVSGSPVKTFDNKPHMQGHVYVTVADGSKFLKVENNNVIRGTVILEGTTRKDTEETEAMVFLYNDTKRTNKEWEEFSAVRVYGIDDDDTATIAISSCNFNNGPYLDFYNLATSEGDNKIDTFWDVGVSASGVSVLQEQQFVTDDFNNLVLAQITDKQTIRETELLTVSGVTLGTPLDMAVQPFSDRVWVVTSDTLYVYDTERYYPDMAKMTKKQYDSYVRIDVDGYHKVRGDQVEVTYRLVRPVKEVAKHRVSIERPDGTKWAVISGSQVPLTATLDYWEFGSINETLLRNPDIFELGQLGDYIFTLETVFGDNTRNIDQRIVSVESKRALAEFDLTMDAVGVMFDSDHKLWILDSGGVHHRIDLATDVMLIDVENKILFLHEEYEEILVST